MTDIAHYIVGFYNSVRLHSKLGNLSPNAFEQQSAIKQPYGGVRKNLTSTLHTAPLVHQDAAGVGGDVSPALATGRSKRANGRMDETYVKISGQ